MKIKIKSRDGDEDKLREAFGADADGIAEVPDDTEGFFRCVGECTDKCFTRFEIYPPGTDGRDYAKIGHSTLFTIYFQGDYD